MLSFLTYFGGMLLVIALWRSNTEHKSMTVAILLIFFIADIGVNNTWLGTWASKGTNYYLFNSFHELLLVWALHTKPCRETAIIMGLSLMSVIAHIIGFSLYVSGIEHITILYSLSMFIFYVMIAVLLSTRISNGIYRRINTINMVRGYCDNYLRISDKGAE